jgi:hypothetical protein
MGYSNKVQNGFFLSPPMQATRPTDFIFLNLIVWSLDCKVHDARSSYICRVTYLCTFYSPETSCAIDELWRLERELTVTCLYTVILHLPDRFNGHMKDTKKIINLGTKIWPRYVLHIMQSYCNFAIPGPIITFSAAYRNLYVILHLSGISQKINWRDIRVCVCVCVYVCAFAHACF